MTNVTISLTDAQFAILNGIALQRGVAIEEVVREVLSEWVERRDEFREAVDYLLQKNAELYRRLA